MTATLCKFWHWLTTSRYTRHLEQENAELKRRLAEYEKLVIPRLAMVQAQPKVETPKEQSPKTPKSAEVNRPKVFKSFSKAKRELEQA